MANYQETVSRMRLGIANRDLLRPPHGEALAEEVNSLCADINRRLGQCLVYLRQGQAGEAVRLARSAPDLGELMAAVDAPQLKAWQNACRELGLPEQTALDRAAWEELHRVLVNDAPFEDLLRRWRQLNLEKAPLAERVAVLRRIVAKDTSASMNLVNDLKTLEAARVEELREFCRDGAVIDDISALRAELDEFNDLDAPEIVALHQRLRALEDTRREQDRRQRFRELADAAVAAWNAQDREAAAAAAEEWDGLKNDGAEPDPAAAAQAAPAFAWMRSEEDREAAARRHARDCAMLAKALDLGAPLEEISALERTAAAGGEIPADLLRRAREETAALHGARKRRRLNWSFAAVAAVLLLGAAGAWHFATAARENDAGKWRRTIESLLQEGRTAEAARVWDDLVAKDEAVARELAALGAQVNAERESAGEAEAERRRQEAAAAKEQEAAAGRAREDAADRARRLEELRAELDALVPAAGGDAFDDRAGKLENALSAAQARNGDTAWQNGVAALQERLQALRKKHAAAARDAADRALRTEETALAGRAADLLAAVPECGAAENTEETRTRLAAEAREVDALREKLLKAHPGDEKLAAVGDAVSGNLLAAREKLALAAFADAAVTAPEGAAALYSAFRRDFPGSPAGEHFLAFLENEMPVWRAAAAWRDLLERAGGTDKVPAADYRAYLRNWPRTPFYAQAQNLYRYAAARERFLAADSPWGAAFAARLQDPILSKVRELVLANGSLVYVTGPGRPSSENYKFTYTVVTGNDFTRDRTERTFSKVELRDPAPRAPAHAALLEKLAAVRPLDAGNWEERGLELADMVRAATDANPLVRGRILLAILDVMLGSEQWPPAMKNALAAQRDELRALCPASLPWLRAGDAAGQAAAAKAGAYLNALPPYADWRKPLADRRPGLAPAGNIVGCALLLPSRVTAAGGDMDHALLNRVRIPASARRVFAACSGKPLAEWLQVGEIRDGKAALSAAVRRPGAFALVFLTD